MGAGDRLTRRAIFKGAALAAAMPVERAFATRTISEPHIPPETVYGAPRIFRGASRHTPSLVEASRGFIDAATLENRVSQEVSDASALGSPGSLTHFGFSGTLGTIANEYGATPLSNIAVIGLEDPRLLDMDAVAGFMERGTRMIVSLHNTLFEYERPPTPQDPYPPFQLRGNYRTALRAALAGKEAAVGGLAEIFYLADEPNWTGISIDELALAHDAVKELFPLIRTGTSINHVLSASWFRNREVPTDVVGYHQYDLRDPRTSALYQQNVQLIKSHAYGKPFFYILDAFWDQNHANAGLALEDMAEVARNTYAMAAADPDAFALIGFHWPQDMPGWTGASAMPESVQWEYRQIGNAITGKPLAPRFVAKPEHALFLQDGRYFATLGYDVPQWGFTGFATAVPETRRDGRFWFFSPDNSEVVLKLFDFGAFQGVYASGMTDLPTRLTIYDAQDGSVKFSHAHPGGTPPLGIVSGFME